MEKDLIDFDVFVSAVLLDCVYFGRMHFFLDFYVFVSII